jgi:hypothetical protein
VRSTKTRIAKLESKHPKETTVIRYIGFDGPPLLTPEEDRGRSYFECSGTTAKTGKKNRVCGCGVD